MITASAQGVSRDIHLKRLNIHAIFPTTASASECRTNLTYYGYGITLENDKESAGSVNRIAVTDCQIENTGHFGILTSAPGDHRVKNGVIWNNHTNPGGKLPADYLPRNRAIIKDQGIVLEKLPGDEIALQGGL